MKLLGLLSIIGVYVWALYYTGRGLDFSGKKSKKNKKDQLKTKRKASPSTFKDKSLSALDIENMHDIEGAWFWDRE